MQTLRTLLVCMAVFSSLQIFADSETYTVKKNDSLWKISKRYYGRGDKWPTIYRANRSKIKNPNVIRKGQKLVIPLKPDKAKPKKGPKDIPEGYEYWKTVKARVTAYEPSWRCCGRFADGKTSTNKNAWIMDGVGAYPKAIPYDTMVYIPKIGWKIVDDTGPAMRNSWRRKRRYHIDVRMTYFYQAKKWGSQNLEVILCKKKTDKVVAER